MTASILFAVACTIEVPYDVPASDAGEDADGAVRPPQRDTGTPSRPEDTWEPVPPWEDTGGSDRPDTRPPPPPPDPDLAMVVEQVFEPSCVRCHGDRPSGGLVLRWRADLYEHLLEPSTQVPLMVRIAPGDPDASYLWRKVVDEHESAGGIGQPMPLDAALTDEQSALPYLWIINGAPRSHGESAVEVTPPE